MNEKRIQPIFFPFQPNVKLVEKAIYHWKWKCINITLGQLDENGWKYPYLLSVLIKLKIREKKEDFRLEFYRVSENSFG